MATIATKTLDFETLGVEFAFKDAEPILVKLEDFPEDVQKHFALHGISQKLGDSYSSAKGDVAVAQTAFAATLEQLRNGEWRAARGEGESRPRSTELAAAIARIKGQPLEEVVANLASATDEQKKALRANERVKATIAVIRAEKAQAKLAAMEGEGAGDLGI